MFMDSVSFSFLFLLALKKQKVEQMAANAATISRANVVLSPVSASLMESFIPRKLTMLSVGGSVVTGTVEAGTVVAGAGEKM